MLCTYWCVQLGRVASHWLGCMATTTGGEEYPESSEVLFSPAPPPVPTSAMERRVCVMHARRQRPRFVVAVAGFFFEFQTDRHFGSTQKTRSHPAARYMLMPYCWQGRLSSCTVRRERSRAATDLLKTTSPVIVHCFPMSPAFASLYAWPHKHRSAGASHNAPQVPKNTDMRADRRPNPSICVRLCRKANCVRSRTSVRSWVVSLALG